MYIPAILIFIMLWILDGVFNKKEPKQNPEDRALSDWQDTYKPK